MAEALTIARPYAEAAFKLAREQGAMPSWNDALGRLAAIAHAPEARAVVGDPNLSVAQLATLFSDSSGTLTAEQKNFVAMLAQNDRLSVLPEISAMFAKLQHAQDGVVDAHVESAFPLSDVQLAEIVQTLEAKVGKKVSATASVNGALIGGVSIKIGDEVMDTSVRGKLAQLSKSLVA
jgi:F-type H+-transporting ATPase subunit delta